MKTIKPYETLTIQRVNELFKEVLPFVLSDETYNAVQSLPQKQRLCITLKYIYDYDFEDIATILGCSAVTVRSNISRAKATMQQKHS